MALYAIGDVQGCCGCLERLLARIDPHPASDRLWFVGDLVNRGPRSLDTLRLVRSLGAEVVLGNHDLHLLAVAAGGRPIKRSDSFDEVLNAPDRDDLLAWLASRPLLVRDEPSRWVMVHAGLPPCWDLETAGRLAREAEAQLQANYRSGEFLEQMYGDYPDHWDPELEGMDRLRFIINAFTRLRFCDARGVLALGYSGPPGSQPAPFRPWYELWSDRENRIVFGHWSALGAGDHGNAVSTDSGCVWGGRLTAARLDVEPVEFVSVGCGDGG
ncbi:MAG TPA: symmetrical bis(5'-nucleosyl)-tetraphosphatase [Arenicellales bacterium]|nr:symmetrical bis(5'-nucleosyl)-tetraphosphatase [Arenicellales bacterium]